MILEQIIKEKKGTVIDVRSVKEYQGGHVAGSLNIPVGDIPMRLEEIKTMKQPLILCCASGTRSALATTYLVQHQLSCYNGGSWQDVNYLQSLHVKS